MLLFKHVVKSKFGRIDAIHVNLEELQETILRIFQFFVGGREKVPRPSKVGLKEFVEGLARLGEPPQVIQALTQHLTPIVNTFPRYEAFHSFSRHSSLKVQFAG